ncbi:MAG: transcription termination/antitermination protein NusG [bacterium]
MDTEADFFKWYAVHTSSRHEDMVHMRLAAKEIPVFLPKIEKWSTRKDRKKRIRVPLFNGYLFINVHLDKYTWLHVLKTPGVARIVGNQNEPVPIPDEQIDSIRILLNNDVMLNPFPYLKIGQRVRIVNGPLTGVEGILVKTDPGKNKLVVSVDLLQRSLSVELNSIDVEPLL